MKSLTQKEIAVILGITPQHMSMILAGTRNPSYKLAKKMGRFTNTSTEAWKEGTPQARREILGLPAKKPIAA